MKKSIPKLLSICLAIAGLSEVALAQNPIPLVNPGFELPGTGKIGDGFDDPANDIPGWMNAGSTYNGSGVEGYTTGATPHSGNWRGFLESQDSGTYQVSTYQLQLGDQIAFTWWGIDGYGGSIQTVSLLSSAATNTPFASTTALSSVTNGLTGTWTQYTITYTAVAADVGKYVGVYFNNSNPNASTWAAIDDVSLTESPAGTPPSIISGPVSQTVYSGTAITLTVSATGATSYQWEAGAVGSGIYTNISNGGQFSGATSASLVISNAQVGNSADYVVVVSNSGGTVDTTGSPATLTVFNLLYSETFPNSGNNNITNVGWRNDLQGDGSSGYLNRLELYQGIGALWSYNGGAANEAFYVTCATGDGFITNQMPFASIDVATATNLTLYMDIDPQYNPGGAAAYFAVQMNGTDWYISSQISLANANDIFTTYSLAFDTNASSWTQLTLSGTGSYVNPNFPGITGNPAPNDLTGKITGAGIVCIHSSGSTLNFANFNITGSLPPAPLIPVINANPSNQTNNSGENASFSVAATTNRVIAGLSFQWMSRPGNTGSFTPLSDGGQYSGSISHSLTVSNLTSLNDQQQFVVVVTDGAGSVTSSPAILSINNIAPTIVNDTTLAPSLVRAGPNVTVNMAASFTGSQPISLQWQFSANSNGSGAVNIPGATNSTYALSNPQTTNTGYYSLQATNNVGSLNSTWTNLTVISAAGALYQWSAPVSFGSLNVTQILNGVTGQYFEAAVFGGTAETVQVGSTTYNFTSDGSSADVSGGYGGGNYGGFSGDTGDPNFNTCLSQFYFDGPTHEITMHNLTVGVAYSVQLFALDDRSGSAGRPTSFQDPNDASDISSSFTMDANDYLLGTFTATNTDMTIQQNLPGSAGNINSLVVRTLGAPSPSIQFSGSNLQINWASGTLLQATNILGPWTTNSASPPSTIITPTASMMFFRVQLP